LYSAVPCILAIDESINIFHKKSARLPEWIKVLVIKPAMIGGINAALQLIHKCESQGIDCIISDTFHSGVGLSVSTALAAGITGHHRAMGLDTYKWLRYDLLKKKFRVRRGQINVNLTARHDNDIRISRLHELITIG
jgi:O-succinylbenzoate synthase